ncbi:4'-phosphopantetheinyl transferase [Cupriavidus sp. H18C1]|uniref:4'-phosphopantetheinyl transferase family protein n=1 Tax=Cupriavidus sp. H18C1 TaxID=3241601 RepID=UPI003BB98E71
MLAPLRSMEPTPVPLPAPLDPYDVRVWRIDIDVRAEPAPGDLAILSPQETARLRGYRRGADRARFAAVRAALRRLLGAIVELTPQAVPLEADPQGKPILPPAIHDAPRFNVSHSGGIGLIAIATDPAVAATGVDIEQCRPVEPLALAASAFAPDEQAMLRGCHPALRLDRFYALWTAREALTKAAGTGIADPRWQQVALQGSGDGRWRPHGPGASLPTAAGAWHPAQACAVVSLPFQANAGDAPYRAALALLTGAAGTSLCRAPLPQAGEGLNTASALPAEALLAEGIPAETLPMRTA